MKFSLSVLTLAVGVFANAAAAQSLKAELQQQPAAQQHKRIAPSAAPQYGVYQLQPQLIAVPQALANRGISKQDIGNMSLVSTAGMQDVEQALEFRRNTVVQNRLTGELGVVTGNISLLQQKNTDIQPLLQQFGLKVVRSAALTGVYIVQPQQDVNLLNLLTQINDSGLVKTARLDILEKRYSNQ
ncbi:MAG: hypothetical protein R3241_07800 [Rheinheimera sp.]|nr:hypothetical protein [Rheinheimera sp.]